MIRWFRYITYCMVALPLSTCTLMAEVNLNPTFDTNKFDGGVQSYFETIEKSFDNITPGVEKRVIWQKGFIEQKTPISVLYIHGFSATSEEIRPVPDLIADALGANLVYTRLQGHGLSDKDAMAEGTITGWMNDLAEGLAAARAVGERVVVISTSTGGTLAAAAALNNSLNKNVAGMIFVSPNFGVNTMFDWIPGLPWAEKWLPFLTGEYLDSSSTNFEANKYWTTVYPWRAVVPMTVLVKKVRKLDYTKAKVPALFWFSNDDKVVRPKRTHKIANSWGGPVTVNIVTMGPGDDPLSHVVAGRIRSPGQIDAAVSGMLNWLKKHGIE